MTKPLMKNKLLPHAEVPDEHDEEHRGFGEEWMPTKETHPYPEEQLCPEETSQCDKKHHGILFFTRMLAFKHP
jgi:hypothetical protein